MIPGLEIPASGREKVARRFWSKVGRHDQPDDCWLWTAAPADRYGYGRMYVSAIAGARRASRVSWALNIGPIPDGMQVMHQCDHPPCVNPAHLLLGTNADNCADKVAKNRQGKGAEIYGAKLSPQLVRAIRSATGTHVAVAERFGLSEFIVRYARQRKTWRHVV